MATKLGVYLVETRRDEERDPTGFSQVTLNLIVAESAAQAEAIAADRTGYVRNVVNVGRLGDFDPGIEGMRLWNRYGRGDWLGSIATGVQSDDADRNDGVRSGTVDFSA